MRARAVVFATRHTDNYTGISRGDGGVAQALRTQLEGISNFRCGLLARRTARAWRAESVLTPQM